MAKLSQIKLGDTAYDLGVTWGNVSGKPSTFPPSSHNHDSVYAKLATTNNFVHSSNEWTVVPSGYSGSLWLNYRTCGGTNGNISSYYFGNGKGGTGGVTLIADAFDGNAASSSCVKDYNNNTPTYFGYSTSGMDSATWIAAWDATVSGQYRLRAIQPGKLSVNYANSAGKATNDSSGYNINSTYSKRYSRTIDLTGYNANTWYPVTIGIPYNGLHRIACTCALNTGSVPSWSSHGSGFTAILEMLVCAGGWGTTAAYSICLLNDQKWISDTSNPPVGYTQFTNSSKACFYCRGGGKYILETDFIADWTLYNSSTTVSSQTVAPVTSYPGVNFTKSRIYANITGDSIYGAVWNDYAEFRICNDDFKPGQVVCENNDDTLSISTERLQPGANIVSDTFGFAIGETDEAKCPIAVSGRVLAYTYEPREEFNAGDAVCAGPNGTVSRMTREEIREYPERIIGTVSAIPNYETWGTGNVVVDNRIWIKV